MKDWLRRLLACAWFVRDRRKARRVAPQPEGLQHQQPQQAHAPSSAAGEGALKVGKAASAAQSPSPGPVRFTSPVPPLTHVRSGSPRQRLPTGPVALLRGGAGAAGGRVSPTMAGILASKGGAHSVGAAGLGTRCPRSLSFLSAAGVPLGPEASSR